MRIITIDNDLDVIPNLKGKIISEGEKESKIKFDNGETCYILNSTFSLLISSEDMDEGEPIMYEGDYPEEDAKKVKAFTQEVKLNFEEEITNVVHCGLTREDFYSIINGQIRTTLDTISEDASLHEKIILSNFTIVHDKLLNILFKNYELTDNRYNEVKILIHISNSCVEGINEYMENFDTNNVSGFLFGFYYSILDRISDYEDWGFKDG